MAPYTCSTADRPLYPKILRKELIKTFAKYTSAALCYPLKAWLVFVSLPWHRSMQCSAACTASMWRPADRNAAACARLLAIAAAATAGSTCTVCTRFLGYWKATGHGLRYGPTFDGVCPLYSAMKGPLQGYIRLYRRI